MTLEDIKSLSDQGKPAEEIISRLDEYIKEKPTDDEALTMRGMKHWSCGHRAEAINDYLAAIKLNPNSKAKMAIKASYEILNYYNKDLYNP
ncbi:MAG: hypothetical protein NC097_07090 [Clostridium sp.]|nr:hypothetical protein [Prevotella sp.]MCM1429541.1 hypothetical protein [Clostridium sp.]MCM1476051.1 hypothetical protein [Muribaculaceae bacterium]